MTQRKPCPMCLCGHSVMEHPVFLDGCKHLNCLCPSYHTNPGQGRLVVDQYEALLERVKTLPPMTSEQVREQRISFAYGNAKLSNDDVTREMVERAVDTCPSRSGRLIHKP